MKKLDDPTLRAHGAAGAYEDPTADPDEPELATLEHWGLQGKDEDKEPVAVCLPTYVAHCRVCNEPTPAAPCVAEPGCANPSA